MTIKTFNYSQFADLRIEGVGIHASFSISLTVKDENIPGGEKVLISATGRTNAAKSAGSGNVFFWCKVRDALSNKVYKLERAGGHYFAVGVNDVFIGSVDFEIKRKDVFSPKIAIEAGYIYDSGYTGSAVPVPSSMKKTITLTPFGRV